MQHGKGNNQSSTGAQRVPYKINPRKNMPRHILIKLTKIKTKRILNAAKVKQQVTYKGNTIRLITDRSEETASKKVMTGYI